MRQLDFAKRSLLYSSSKRGNLQKHRLSRQGFTLVELSIVLVIIGLLIGGVLIGQSLIQSAKINAQIRQFQQFDIAAQSFVSKFKYLPGDADKDGWLEESGGYPSGNKPCSPSINQECALLFPQLSSMLRFPGNYSYTLPDTLRFGPGRQFPYDAMGRGGIVPVQNVRRELFWVDALYKGCTDSTLCGYDGNNGISGSVAMTPAEAMSIDSKLDDGNAFTGSVATTTSQHGGVVTYPSSCSMSQMFCGNTKAANPDDYPLTFSNSSRCANQTTGAYLVSSSAYVCGLQVKAKVYK